MFEYVLMKYDVQSTYQINDTYSFNEVNLSKEDLYPLFNECFQTGDAEFYHNLPITEKEQYYNEQLGFPEVLTHPASQLVYFENQLVGFALCMNYLRSNIHISCMCVLPDFQHRGIGKLMLEHIETWCSLNNIHTITLGTERNMKAFKLYSSFGFRVTESHIVD